MMRSPTHGLAISRLLKERISRPCIASCLRSPRCSKGCRHFAVVKDLNALECEVWFTSTAPRPLQLGDNGDHKPPDQRTLQLGKTVRELHERLPTLLQTPLPSDILSPQITLHLFPSTHPHLPKVSGRIAYVAALWTAPVAWGRIPLIGNVKLTILSERMLRLGGSAISHDCREEKLIVKWKTRGRGGHRDTSGGIYRDDKISAKDPEDKIRNFLQVPARATSEQQLDDQDFCGIFIFEFDEAGRIRKHVIEHTEQNGHEDKMNKFVNVTDWLLGKFNNATKGDDIPALAYYERSSGLRDGVQGDRWVDASTIPLDDLVEPQHIRMQQGRYWYRPP